MAPLSRRSLLKVSAGLAASLALFSSAEADARRPWLPRPPPPPAFSLTLESPDGRRLPTFSQRGQTFVLGQEGDRYSVVVNNPTSRRVEAVVTVDGRDVLSGQRGSFAQRGYIVPAFGSVRIEGFRQSLDHVAAFRFTSPGQSYSAQLGTPENVGVIGVAIFDERNEPAIAREHRRSVPRASAAPPGRAKPAPPRPSAGRADPGIGTGWGEDRVSRVTQVRFERARSTPSRVLTVRYDDAAGLQARGIDLGGHLARPVRPQPDAFPDARFAAPPPRR